MIQKRSVFSFIFLFSFVFSLVLFMGACTTEKDNLDERKNDNIEIIISDKIYDGQQINVAVAAESEKEVKILFVNKNEIGEQDLLEHNLTKERLLNLTSINAPKNAGDYYIIAYTEQDEQFNFCVAIKPFTISPKELTLNWIAPNNLVYDNAIKEPGVNIINLETGDECDAVITLNSGDNENVTANGFTYKITGLTNTNYKLPSDIISPNYLITKATPNYTVPTNLAATYGQTLAEVTLPNGFEFINNSQTLVGNAGTQKFMVKYTPQDTQNYEVVTNIEVSIAVSKANHQTVIAKHKLNGENDWRESNAYNFGDTIELGALYQDNSIPVEQITYEIKANNSSAEGVINGNILTITKAGTLYFVAHIAESENYFGANTEPQALVINKINATISLNNNFVLTKTYDGIAFASPTENDYSITPSGAEIVIEWYSGENKLNSAPTDAGTYTLKLSFSGNDNYNSCAVEKIVQITKATEQITINDLTRYYDAATISPIYSYSGNRSVLVEYKLKTQDDSEYVASDPNSVGDYVVRVTIAGDNNYEEVVATKEFSINPYTINYVLYGGTNSNNNPNTYISTDLPLALYDATKDNCVFDGWFLNDSFGNEYKITQIVSATGNLTLYAKFTENARLTYVLNEDNESYKVTGIDDLCGSTQIIIPDKYNNLNVTKIAENAFADQETITSVKIGSNVQVIESFAFKNCTSLTFVDFPDSITEICSYAFFFDDDNNKVGQINSVVFGTNLTTVGDDAFYNSRLTKIYYKGTTSGYSNIDFGDTPLIAEVFYLTSNGENETIAGNWWYYENGEITENVVIYCTVTYISGENDTEVSITVLKGSVIDTPEEAEEIEELSFVCWCTDEEHKNEFDFSTPIESDLTLYAKYVLN